MSGIEPARDDAAALYAHQVAAFRIHAAVFVAGMSIMFVVNLATNVNAGLADEWSAWWSAWALVGWSIGLAVHGFVLYLQRLTVPLALEGPTRSRPPK